MGEITPIVPPGTPSPLDASLACQPTANLLFDEVWEQVDPVVLARARSRPETVREYPGRLGWAATVMLDHAPHLEELDEAISVILSWAARPDPRPPGGRSDDSSEYQPPLPGFGTVR